MFQRHPQQIRAITELYYNNGDIDDMLDSLDTLYETSREDNGIRIATLNFSGINTSPL